MSLLEFRFTCFFTSRSTARVILRWVVLQEEETSAYCTVNHPASASNYQLSNMKRPARDSNRRRQRLEARTLTATPPSPRHYLNHKEYIATSYRPYSGFIYMQCTRECIIRHMKTLQVYEENPQN